MVSKKIEPYILALGVVLCGTVQSNNAWDASVTIRHLVWLAVTAVLLLMIFIRRDFSQLRNPCLLLFAGYWFMTVVSGFQANNRSEWVYEVLKTGTMCTFLFVCLTCVGRKIIAWTVTCLAVVLSVYSYIQIYQVGAVNVKGLMGNRNPWAAALMLTIPFCFMTKKVFVLFPLGNVAILLARSSILAVGVMSLFAKKLKWVVICIGIVVFCLKTRSITNTESLSDRHQIWSASLAMVKDNPFGVGAGNWKLEIPVYSKHFNHRRSEKTFATLLYTRPHNGPLWTWSETGLPGMVFLYGALGVGVVIAWQKKDYVVAAGILGYLVFDFFSFPLERVFHPVILCVLLALATKKMVPAARCSSKATIILALVMSAFFAGSGYVFYQRHRCNCQSRTIRATRNDNKRLAALEDISWFAAIDRCTVPLYTYRAVLRQRAGDTIGALNDMNKSVRANPNHSLSLIMLATCLENAGMRKEARYWHKRARQISPMVDKVIIEALMKKKET